MPRRIALPSLLLALALFIGAQHVHGYDFLQLDRWVRRSVRRAQPRRAAVFDEPPARFLHWLPYFAGLS